MYRNGRREWAKNRVKPIGEATTRLGDSYQNQQEEKEKRDRRNPAHRTRPDAEVARRGESEEQQPPNPCRSSKRANTQKRKRANEILTRSCSPRRGGAELNEHETTSEATWRREIRDYRSPSSVSQEKASVEGGDGKKGLDERDAGPPPPVPFSKGSFEFATLQLGLSQRIKIKRQAGWATVQEWMVRFITALCSLQRLGWQLLPLPRNAANRRIVS
ncbi:hypothetical protein NL676_031389 [Syzygium grande]|nr:hypothetical protein NL676_031389 [Syzygium grande]